MNSIQKISAPTVTVTVTGAGAQGPYIAKDKAILELVDKAEKSLGIKNLRLDFSGAPDADAIARLASEKALRSRELPDLLRFLAAAGVTAGYEATHGANFVPRALLPFPVKFGREDMPWEAAKLVSRVQECVSDLAKLYTGKDEKGQAFTLRHVAQRVSEIGNELVGYAQALSAMGKPAANAFAGTMAAIQNVVELDNRTFYAMTEFVESTKRNMGIPTESSWPVIDGGGLAFRNTFRGQRMDENGRLDEAQAALDKFAQKGGRQSDVVRFDAKVVAAVKDGELAEFVVKKSGEAITSTHPEIKHSILASVELDAKKSDRTVTFTETGASFRLWGEANGDDALAAGGVRIFKDQNGDVVLALANAKSGHFRGGIDGVEQHLVPELVKAGIPRDRIIVCGGDFFDPSTVLAIDIWEYRKANPKAPEAESKAAVGQLVKNYEALRDKVQGEARERVAATVAEAKA